MSLDWHDGFEVGAVLTRRDDVVHPEESKLTRSVDDLLRSSDVIFECSGDPLHATDVITEAVEAAIPVVTLNAEFHVTAGSSFVSKGLVSEAEGDQPGSLAALHFEAKEMGFEPLVYGNMKGFLNHDPSREDMEYWSERQGLSVEMTTSFTDGTKLQIEQALVANGMAATIKQRNLLGPEVTSLTDGAQQLSAAARELGRPISDYILGRGLSHGVFIVAAHHEEHREALDYFKLGPGPDYLIERPNILVHLEAMKTIKRILDTGSVLLDNSVNPEVSVAAVAKLPLEPGTPIAKGIGSFMCRGEAVLIADEPGHVPIGLLQSAVVERHVERGQTITFDDVQVPDSLAKSAWESTVG